MTNLLPIETNKTIDVLSEAMDIINQREDVTPEERNQFIATSQKVINNEVSYLLKQKENMTLLSTILHSIGHFFADLFKRTEQDFEALTPEQQQAIINGSTIPQVIKNNLDAGEDYITLNISTRTGLPIEVVQGLLQHVFDEANVKTLAEYQNLLKQAENSSLWKGILDTAARVAAIAISKGSLTWESLGLGLLQVGFEKYVKGS